MNALLMNVSAARADLCVEAADEAHCNCLEAGGDEAECAELHENTWMDCAIICDGGGIADLKRQVCILP